VKRDWVARSGEESREEGQDGMVLNNNLTQLHEGEPLMQHSAKQNSEGRRSAYLPRILSASLCAGLALCWWIAPPVLAGESQPGTGELPVPGNWDNNTTPVGFINLDLLKVHLDCITQPPPPDPIGPVVTLIAFDWDGDRREEVGGFDPYACKIIEPADLCGVLGGPDPQPWMDPDPVSWNVLSGDWNGDGFETVAVFDLETCQTVPLSQIAPENLILPEAGSWRFLAGDWDGSGETSVLMARPHDACGEETIGLFAGRWDGVNDSLATVDGQGTMVPINLDGPLVSAFESNQVPMPEPEEACLDFELQCWTFTMGGFSHTLCLRKRCCLGAGCYEYLGEPG